MATDKLREREARDIWLQIAAKSPNLWATTTDVKGLAAKYRSMSPDDLKPSRSRPHETMWEQIMGNVISHQEASTSLFKRGLATRTQDGIQITAEGLEYLKKKGLL